MQLIVHFKSQSGKITFNTKTPQYIVDTKVTGPEDVYKVAAYLKYKLKIKAPSRVVVKGTGAQKIHISMTEIYFEDAKESDVLIKLIHALLVKIGWRQNPDSSYALIYTHKKAKYLTLLIYPKIFTSKGVRFTLNVYGKHDKRIAPRVPPKVVKTNILHDELLMRLKPDIEEETRVFPKTTIVLPPDFNLLPFTKKISALLNAHRA